uniref:guanylate cyclase n=1 Tax=Gongylonema pulchrum TaxID=637853 RepID=A0A183EYI8_9BILA
LLWTERLPVIDGEDGVLQVSKSDFISLQPYHFIADHDCKLIQCGKGLYSALNVEKKLKLKGQMIILGGGNRLLYIGSPYISTIPELLDCGMRLEAMPLHDVTRDVILTNQQRLSDVEMKFVLDYSKIAVFLTACPNLQVNR